MSATAADPLKDAIEELKRRLKTTVFRPKPKAAKSFGFFSVPPRFPSYALPLDEAETELHRQMARFFDAVPGHAAAMEAYEAAIEEDLAIARLATPLTKPVAPVYALAATTGLGKTRAAAKAIQRFLAGDPDRLVCFAAPTLALADQVAEDFRRAGLTEVRVYRGRDTADPEAEGQSMCLDLAAVRLALEADVGDIQRACCRYKPKGKDAIECAHYSTCGYQAQKREKPRVWIIAHALLFIGAGDLPKFDALVIDESFWREALPERPYRVMVRSLYGTPEIWGKDGRLDLNAMNDLELYRRSLMAALEANGTGAVRSDILAEHGISPSTAQAAKDLEWRRKSEADDMRPGMPLAERRRIAEAATENRKARRDAGVWASVRQCVELVDSVHSGRLRLVEKESEDGAVLTLENRPLREMPDRWSIPTLILDATLPDGAIMSALHPQVRISAPIEVDPPECVVVRQVVEAPVTSTKLGLNEWAKTGGDRNVRDLARFIKAIAAKHHPERIAVVCQMAAVDRLRRCDMPPSVEFKHFNNLRGLNDWQDIRALIVAGHVLPPAPDVENSAAVLTGVDRLRIQPDDFGRLLYERTVAGIRTPDGGVGITVAQHPDPVTEAVRRAICDDELVQAVGRARAIRRTEASPLDLWIVADEVLPLTVNEVWRWPDVLPGVWAEMVGAGIVLTNGADIMKAFPGLFSSEDAARKATNRASGGVGQTSKEYILYREVSHSSCRYKPAGIGQKTRTAAWFPRILATPREWLEARLGPLVDFSIDGAGDPGPAPSSTASDPAPAAPAGDDFEALASSLPVGGASSPFPEPPMSFTDVAAFC